MDNQILEYILGGFSINAVIGYVVYLFIKKWVSSLRFERVMKYLIIVFGLIALGALITAGFHMIADYLTQEKSEDDDSEESIVDGIKTEYNAGTLPGYETNK